MATVDKFSPNCKRVKTKEEEEGEDEGPAFAGPALEKTGSFPNYKGVLQVVFASHPNTVVSGGADGADYEWTATAAKAGHNICTMSFKGHARKGNTGQVFELKDFELEMAAPSMTLAGKLLGRTPSSGKPYMCNLLRRDCCIASEVSSLYAVGMLARLTSATHGVQVVGGTAWGCQAFALRHLPNVGAIPMYFFDQNTSAWYQCNLEKSSLKWVRIESPPAPTGSYAGIGTRGLNADGKKAIHDLYV